MNRGVLQSSPVQQMMAGNPNWWNINGMRPPPQQPSPFLPPLPLPQYTPSWHDSHDLPESWSQLLLGGLVGGEEEKSGMKSWEEQVLHPPPPPSSVVDIKQENSATTYMYGHGNEEFQATKPAWSQIMPASSPKSCVTSFSSNMLDFSSKKSDVKHPLPDRSSECNSGGTGGALKKARVQAASASSTTQSSSSSTFKVRKEKLGDRITALHQLVSPFGKTDTASVLLEAIGYIRFLQSQIEALSLPYLGGGSSNMKQQQQQQPSSVQGERNCIFPEDPGQLLNDNGMKRKAASDQDSHEEPKKDLRSRGLCLVPVSCTLQVGSDNGADYWAPALGGGGFR